jgi:serine/threonine protein kinase
VNDLNYVIKEYALPPWSVLEQYRIEEILRYDRFSITYKAFNIKLDLPVNIKEALPHDLVIRKSDNKILAKFPSDEDVFQKQLEYFVETAETLAKLNHPNIVRVLGSFKTNGTAYMVMSHENGETLRQQLDHMGPDKTMPEERIKPWLKDILCALKALHEKGIYHKNIRTDTIFLKKDGSAMLIDFGAAGYDVKKEFHNQNAASSDEHSPEYLHAHEEKDGLWADIYHLGNVIYECVTGQKLPDIQVRIQSSINNESDPDIEALKQAVYRGYSKDFLDTIALAISCNATDRQSAINASEKLILISDNYVTAKEKEKDILDEEANASKHVKTCDEEIILEMEDTDEDTEGGKEEINSETDSPETLQTENEEKPTIKIDEENNASKHVKTCDEEILLEMEDTDEDTEAKEDGVADKPGVFEHVQVDDHGKLQEKDKKGRLLKVVSVFSLIVGLLAVILFVFLRPGLKVVSKPSASAVFLDKNYIGETPLSTKRWMCGKHIITVKKKDYNNYEQSIKMSLGKTKKIYVELSSDAHANNPYASLVIKTLPEGATVLVDGKEKGVTPLYLKNVEHGLHTIKFTKNCFSSVEKKVDITASKTIDVNAKLQSICGSLMVKSSPEGATVLVDGKEKGVTPLYIDNIKKGDRIIKLIKKGFETENKIVSIKPSEKFDFSVKLRRPIVSSDGRFIDHRNGTISDTKTGLMWTKDDSYVHLKKYLNWKESRSYVNNLTTGGYSDWRLPTTKELNEIYEIKKSNTDKDGDIIHIDPIFSIGGTFWNWSSEEQDKCRAKVFLFLDGSIIKNDKNFSYERGVRAVRP